jgi:hypothetical protein
MIYDATKIKTYQPILPTGKGPVGAAYDAFMDILIDIHEKVKDTSVTEKHLEMLAEMFASFVSDWIEGEYTIFEDYKLVIKRYTRTELDKMPDFEGY